MLQQHPIADRDARSTGAFGDLDGQSRLRLQTGVRLRWFAVGGQLITVGFVYGYLGFDLPIGFCLALIAASAWLNVYLRFHYPSGYRLSEGSATALFAYDLVQLGALLYLTGGIDNPFTVLIVAPVTVSAATLPLRTTLLLGAGALAITALLAVDHLQLPWTGDGAFELPPLYRLGVFASVVACLVFLTLYAWRLSKEARQMSAALAATELVLAREQKLHALDGLAAAAAHELGTPLATIVLVAKELEGAHGDNPDLVEDLALLRSQATRCREILQTLTRAPSERDPMHASMSLAQIADEAAAPYRERDKDIRIRTIADADRDGPEPMTERNPGMLFGFGNLVENAVDFARSEVAIDVGWNHQDVFITIVDDGPGFPPDILDEIGDPFISRRATAGPRSGRQGGGLGLGVFIAKTLLERTGAVLTLENVAYPGSGAIVKIVWSRQRFVANDAGDEVPTDRSGVVPESAS